MKVQSRERNQCCHDCWVHSPECYTLYQYKLFLSLSTNRTNLSHLPSVWECGQHLSEFSFLTVQHPVHLLVVVREVLQEIQPMKCTLLNTQHTLRYFGEQLSMSTDTILINTMSLWKKQVVYLTTSSDINRIRICIMSHATCIPGHVPVSEVRTWVCGAET